MPESWYNGITLPNVENFDPDWNESSYVRKDLLPGIFKYFEDYGVEYFEKYTFKSKSKDGFRI